MNTVGVCTQRSMPFIVLELMSRGDLLGLLRFETALSIDILDSFSVPYSSGV